MPPVARGHRICAVICGAAEYDIGTVPLTLCSLRGSFVFSLYGTLEEEALLDNLSRAFSVIFCIEIALRISTGGFEKFVNDPRGECGPLVRCDACTSPHQNPSPRGSCE